MIKIIDYRSLFFIFLVTQPKYEIVGESIEECLEDYPVFKKWVEENLPSHHRK